MRTRGLALLVTIVLLSVTITYNAYAITSIQWNVAYEANTECSQSLQAASDTSQEMDDATASLSEFQKKFKEIGINIDVAHNGIFTHVTATLNEDHLPQIVSVLKGMHIMNPDVTQTYINMHPVALETYLLNLLAAPTLVIVYKDNATTDRVIFHAKLDVPDEYGKQTLHETFFV